MKKTINQQPQVFFEHFSAQSLARRRQILLVLGCKPYEVRNWFARKSIPLKHAGAIQLATEGKVKASDIFPETSFWR